MEYNFPFFYYGPHRVPPLQRLHYGNEIERSNFTLKTPDNQYFRKAVKIHINNGGSFERPKEQTVQGLVPTSKCSQQKNDLELWGCRKF